MKPKLLRLLILVAIAIAAGPEVFAAMELQLLLELLGATLFVTSFAWGARLAVRQVITRALNLLIPAAQASVLRGPARPMDKALATAYIVAHVSWWLAFAIACFAFVEFMSTVF